MSDELHGKPIRLHRDFGCILFYYRTCSSSSGVSTFSHQKKDELVAQLPKPERNYGQIFKGWWVSTISRH